MHYNKSLIPVFYLMLFSCDTKNPYENNLGIEPALVAQIDTAHYTLIQWQNSLLNFGTIKIGDSVHLKYWFKNVGSTPLFILSTKPGCGCTITSFPKDPIMPGKSSYISATLKSGYHTGEINKTITVVSNTKNHTNSILIIRGTVLPSDKK